MTECLIGAIIAGIISVIGLGTAFGCTYLTYKLAMATLKKGDHHGPD
jgi:hypothetical protein